MLIRGTRIGEVEITDKDLIKFNDGFPGLPDWLEGVLVPIPDVPVLCWLQFTHDEDAAFLLLDVKEFAPDYDCRLARKAASMTEGSRVYTIVTVPNGDFAKSTTNLLAPVVIEAGDKPYGAQVILHDTNYPLRQPLFRGDEQC